MVKQKKISAYKSAKDRIGYDVPYAIESIIDAIRNDTYKSATHELRALKNSGADKKVLSQFKASNFKAVTWSGRYSQRNVESLIEHSGIICFDFDNLSQDRINKLSENLASDPHVLAAFVSPSGDGLKALYLTSCTNASEHYEYFKSISDYILSKYLEMVDPSGSDPTRLCFLPYDPYVFTNYDAVPFVLENEFGVSSVEKFGSSLIAEQKEFDKTDEIERVKKLVSKVVCKGVDLTAQYNEWVKIGASFASLGEQGREFFHSVSSLNSSYEYSECDKKFNNLLKTAKGSVQISTFFYLCKENGIELDPQEAPRVQNNEDADKWKHIYSYIHNVNHEGRPWTEGDINFLGSKYEVNGDKIKKAFTSIFKKYKDEYGLDSMPDIFKVEAHLRRNFKFVRNEVTQRTEYTTLPEMGEFQRMDADTIFRNLQHNHFKFPMDKLKSLLRSDFVPTINPFKEYFFNLPPWDGQTDHIGLLASFIQCEDQDFFVDMFRKSLVRSIACSIGGRENRIVMVFVQEQQNTGKSNFIRFLNPFGTKYYTEAPLRDNKDTEFRFAENFIYNLEELASLGAIDINKLKAVISKAYVKERKAYAEDECEQPRRCNFWGSTNKPEFLTDTENTRWLCFKIISIDHDYRNLDTGVQKVDINKVWAQAYALYASGQFNYQLTADESHKRDNRNKEYEMSSDEKDLINTHYVPSNATEQDSRFVSTADIVLELSVWTENRIKFNRVAIGRAMSQLGFVAERMIINKNKVRGFWVKNSKVKPKPEEPNLFNQDDTTPF